MLQDLDYIPTPWGNAEKYGNGGGGISLDSPAFTGTPTAPTAAAGTNSTQLATTEFVTYAITVSGNNLSSHISNTVAHGATALNTASRIVLRDENGDFSAGNITASLLGNAATATKLATPRKINTIDFDGSADITIPITGSITLGTTVIDLGDTVLSLSGLTSVEATTFSGALSGNAATATKLATARKINGIDFDGSADINIQSGAAGATIKYYFEDANIEAFMPLAAKDGKIYRADYDDATLIDVIGFATEDYENNVEKDIQKIGKLEGLPPLDKTFTPLTENIIYCDFQGDILDSENNSLNQTTSPTFLQNTTGGLMAYIGSGGGILSLSSTQLASLTISSGISCFQEIKISASATSGALVRNLLYFNNGNIDVLYDNTSNTLSIGQYGGSYTTVCSLTQGTNYALGWILDIENSMAYVIVDSKIYSYTFSSIGLASTPTSITSFEISLNQAFISQFGVYSGCAISDLECEMDNLCLTYIPSKQIFLSNSGKVRYLDSTIEVGCFRVPLGYIKDKTSIDVQLSEATEVGEYVNGNYSSSTADGNIGVNWLSGQFDEGIGEWVSYNDGDVSVPIDGIGGATDWTQTITRNTTSTGTNFSSKGCLDLAFFLSLFSHRGCGYSAPFSIDGFARKKVTMISFEYFTELTAHFNDENPFSVFVVDVDNGGVIPASVSVIPNANAPNYSHIDLVFIPSSSVNYRLCFHITSSVDYASWEHLYLANIQIGSKTITQGAAIGEWQSFTPTITGGMTLSANNGRWRRVGSNMEIQTWLQSSAAGGGASQVTTLIPSGYTIDISRLSGGYGASGNDIGSAQWYKPGEIITPISVTIQNANTLEFFRNTGVSYLFGSDLPANAELGINVSIPISQWAESGTVGLVQNYEEYASNSDVTATASVTGSGFLQGFGNFGGFGAGWTVGTTWIRRVKFSQPIQWGRDILSIGIKEPSNGMAYDDVTKRGHIQAYQMQGTGEYGSFYRAVSNDPYSADVVFCHSGRIATGSLFGSDGDPFSSLSAYQWFVKKTSAGKPGETLPLVRAEYTNQITTAADTALIYNNKIEDTHSGYNPTNGRYTFPVSGVYTVSFNNQNATSLSTLRYALNGGTKIPLADVPASYLGRQTFTVRVTSGQYLELFSGSISTAVNYARMTIELLGR